MNTAPPLPFPLYLRTVDPREYTRLLDLLQPGLHTRTLYPACLPVLEQVLSYQSPHPRHRYDVEDLLTTRRAVVEQAADAIRAGTHPTFEEDTWGSLVQMLLAVVAMPGYQSYPYDITQPLSDNLVILGELDSGLGFQLRHDPQWFNAFWENPGLPQEPIALGYDLRLLRGDALREVATRVDQALPGLPLGQASVGDRLRALLNTSLQAQFAVGLSDL